MSTVLIRITVVQVFTHCMFTSAMQITFLFYRSLTISQTIPALHENLRANMELTLTHSASYCITQYNIPEHGETR